MTTKLQSCKKWFYLQSVVTTCLSNTYSDMWWRTRIYTTLLTGFCCCKSYVFIVRISSRITYFWIIAPHQALVMGTVFIPVKVNFSETYGLRANAFVMAHHIASLALEKALVLHFEDFHHLRISSYQSLRIQLN